MSDGTFGVPHADLDPPKVLRAPYTLKEPLAAVDPVTYEIIKHRLWTIGLMMGETFKKVSGSVVAAEANDMATYITLEDGAPVFLGPYIVFFSGICDLVVSNTIRLNADDPGIRDGDMFLLNDPWLGPCHQSDLSIVQPLFVGDELFLWTGITLHEIDVGGVDPGSLCPHAKDAYAEANIYPAVKIVEGGKLKADIDRTLRRNSRLPGIMALDLRSQVAGNLTARKHLERLVQEYDRDVVKSVMILMQNRTSDLFRKRLKSLPHGTFRARDFFEIGGADPVFQDDVYEVDCTLQNDGEKLVLDFSGTSKQSGGFVNSGLGGLRGGVLGGLLETLAWDIPWNAGILVNLEIRSQEGTTHNPKWPAAVSCGVTEGAVSTALATGGAVCHMLLGDEEARRRTIGGTGSVFCSATLGGLNPDGTFWGTLLMDPIGMGGSANESQDGLQVCGSGGIPFSQFANVEHNELHYPLLYLWRRTGRDHGSYGYRNGGRGIEFAVKPHKTPFIYTLFWNHGAEFPNIYSLAGATPASAASYRIARASGVEEGFQKGEMRVGRSAFPFEAQPAKGETMLGSDDVMYYAVPASLAYGDPLLREPERAAADVQNGVLSPEQARKTFGLVMNGGSLDREGTERERRAIREARIRGSLPVSEWGRLEPRQGVAGAAAEEPPKRRSKAVVRVGIGLEVVRRNSHGFSWSCSECGHVYGPLEENPRLKARVRVIRLEEVHPLAQFVRIDAPRFFFREYFCPACAVRWAGEIGRPEDPILFAIQYDPAWLEGRAAEGASASPTSGGSR